MTQEIKIKFIPEKEADHDAFGVHTQTAKALSEIIVSNINNTIRTIGLLGDWGSGKSTVVKYTQRMLEKEHCNKFFFFDFDAWLHQGDAPRRSFLESLIEKGVECNVLDKEQYDKTKETIQGRQEEHTINTTPIFTVWGVLIAISILFIPLAARIFDNSGPIFTSKNIFAFTLTSLPLLIALTNYILWRDKKIFKGVPVSTILLAIASFCVFFGAYSIESFSDILSRINIRSETSRTILMVTGIALIFLAIKKFYNKNIDFIKKHKTPYKDSSILELFIKKATDRVTNKIIKTPDPTSIEFSSIFHKIIQDFNAKGKEVVIIFDNLDRVEKNTALKMWAMIRSLLTEKGTYIIEESAYKDPFVIIPLDQTSIKEFYGSSIDEKDERANSFSDKTFDVVLRLSPPIFSDWEAYLSQQLSNVFGSLVSAEAYIAINKFFRFNHEQKNQYLSKITPRKINSILNKAAAQYLLWKEGIPICTIFYYIVMEEYLGENLSKLSDAPLQSTISTIDSDWIENIASIHYGVEKSKAIQVYIEPDIVESVTNGNFNLYMEKSIVPGFITIFEKTIEKSEVIKSDARYILNCALFASKLKLNPVDTLRIKSILGQLHELFVETKKWPADTTSIEGARVFLDEKLAVPSSLIEHMAISLDDTGRQWAQNFTAYIDILTKEEVKDVQENLQIPGDAPQFINILYEMYGEFSKNNAELMKCFTPSANRDEVITSYLDFAENQDNYDEDSIWMLCALREIEALGPALSSVFKRIEALISIETLDGVANAIWAIKALLNICFKNKKMSIGLMSSGHIFNAYHLISTSQNKESADALNTIILLLLIYNPTLQGASGGNGQQALAMINSNKIDEDFISSFAPIAHTIMNNTGHHLEIFDNLINTSFDNHKWDEIVSAIIAYKLNAFGNLGHIYRSLYTDNLHKVIHFISDDNLLQKLISHIGGYSWFYERFDKIANDATVYKVIDFMQEESKIEKTNQAFFDYLCMKNAEWWENSFAVADQEEFPINRLAKIHPSLRGNLFGEDFLSGLESHLSLFKQKDAVAPPLAKDDWVNLLGYIDEDKRVVFLSNAYDMLYTATDYNANILLTLYFEEIKNLQSAINDCDRFARRILDILKNDAFECEEIHIINAPQKYSELIKHAYDATRNEIRSALVRMYEEHEDGDEHEKLKAAINTLGFRVSQKKAKKSEIVTPAVELQEEEE